ncbi:hypothetical protein PIB30_017916 [Stylosanthes scabra]|uniref:Uncharacterized protein n=1 Tax=Stylosanthes scabra TaxID=79078 RepID=A0ABU6Q7K8_9FABA|nr:hypothetical protein [Stylosanthes scabra]
MLNSSNPAFTSSKVDLEELLEDVVSEDVVLEEPKMQTVSQEILGCEKSDNQEEQKKQLRKEESETMSDCFSECEQKIFEKQNKNCEEDLKCASMLPFENFMGIMVSIEGLKVDRQEARQATAYFHEHLHGGFNNLNVVSFHTEIKKHPSWANLRPKKQAVASASKGERLIEILQQADSIITPAPSLIIAPAPLSPSLAQEASKFSL